MTPLDWATFSLAIAGPLTVIVVTAIWNRRETWKVVLEQLPKVYNAVEEARRRSGRAVIGDPLAYALRLIESMTGFRLSAAQKAQATAALDAINYELKAATGAVTGAVAAPTLGGLPVIGVAKP
jgi:hypothetical protein